MRRMGAGILAAAAFLLAAPGHAVAGGDGFDRERPAINDWHLFDLGVVDYDGDADLDLYTVNHNERQSLLANDGAGRFTERFAAARLSHTPGFPGWEGPDVARGRDPGLYLSQHGRMLLRLVGDRRAKGSVEFMFPPRVGSTGKARTEIHRDRRPGHDRWIASFAMNGDSVLVLDPHRISHPFVVRIDRPFPLQRVFAGSEEVSPVHRRFVLYVRDRHGMAWADYDRDRDVDAFSVRGGLQGKIRELSGLIEDQLLFQRQGRFHEAAGNRGIEKGACRGRSAGSVDFNHDGLLDLFATCKEQRPKLYRRVGGDRFEDASGQLRRSGVGSWVMRWLDLQPGGREEILTVHDTRFGIFEREPAGWRQTQGVPGRHNGVQNTALAPADFDADGDLDVYVAAPDGSTLLVNRRRGMRARNPAAVGLAPFARAAAWVDFDNDGLPDLHAIPQGLFRQQPNGRFDRTGLLAVDTAEARIAWPDLDLDGARDGVIARRRQGSGRSFITVAYLNGRDQNHWLEVDLVGRAGNPQAIGARVEVRSGGMRQTQWVGQNETSLYSQGHYRLYFGLGADTSPRVRVIWPGGPARDLGAVAADQLLTVRR